SLGLNIFAVGFLSGRVLGEKPPPLPPPAIADAGAREPSMRLLHYADALPPERRAVFREAFRERLPEMRGDFRDMRRLRRQMAAQLGAESFDRAALETTMDEIHALRSRQQHAFSEAFLDAFEELTPEERAMLREAAEARRGEKRHHRGRFRRGPGER
ncbi:MAG: periplasmic heavy metal sensor, partial [Hyphococcus sp.]